MPDTKITALAAITTVAPSADLFPIVDVSDNSMAASGTTKNITVNQLLGAGGTATLASATISGDLTVDTSTLKVDSANNRVGIGIATPSNQLHVKATGSTPALIETSGGALAYLQFTSTTGSAYIGNNANGLGFYTTGSADLRMSLAAAGDLSITSGNVVMGTSGKGIDFSATASGSGTMTSELLNDYEEGTFTPTIVGTSTAGTGTYTQQIGRYTKVGRLVTVDVYVAWYAHTGTGNMQIAGLPFTTSSSPYSSVSFGYLSGIALTAGNTMIGFTQLSDTKIELWQTPTGGGTSTVVPVDTAGDIICSVTYTV